MPQVGFEPTISVFERKKTVHALDRAATVIGTSAILLVVIPLVTVPLRSQQKVVLQNLIEVVIAEYTFNYNKCKDSTRRVLPLINK
jgi:cobalamin biosynthesis protein CobD/CbiB